MTSKEEMKALEEILENAQQRAGTTGVKSVVETNAGIVQMGDVFEAKTVKGGTNYIIFMFEKDEWSYYFHGDKGKKIKSEQFRKLIDYGDLVFIPREKRDPERMALAVLSLNAMSNGMAFNDYLDVMYGTGQRSEMR